MLIGLTGAAGSGKDTVGDYLIRAHKFTRLAYADALKTTALDINPYIMDTERLATLVAVHGMDFVKRAYPEARRFLQELGLAMRAVDPEIWLRPLDRLIEAGHRNIVVTDVRFDNEAQQVTDYGGTVVNVIRPGAGLKGTLAAHASELGVDPRYITYSLVNDKDITALYGEVEEFLSAHN